MAPGGAICAAIAAVAFVADTKSLLRFGAVWVKTSLLALARIGVAPVLLRITETVFIGLLVVSLIYALRVVGM